MFDMPSDHGAADSTESPAEPRRTQPNPPALTPRPAATEESDDIMAVISAGGLSDDAALRLLKAKLRVMQACLCEHVRDD
jgi:hypothetical protein